MQLFSLLKQVIKITYCIYFMIILLLYIEKRRIKNYYSRNLYDDLLGFFFSSSINYPNILWNIVNNRTIHNTHNCILTIYVYYIVNYSEYESINYTGMCTTSHSQLVLLFNTRTPYIRTVKVY